MLWLSDYANKLPPEAVARYIEKLTLIKLPNCDPYNFTPSLWKTGLDCCSNVPCVLPNHIFIYVVETRSEFNNDTLDAFKGLSQESIKSVKDGWVQQFQAIKLATGTVLVKAKVVHSQSIHDPPALPWAAILPNGSVACAHCNCPAGLGEVCNHVACLLHVVSVASQINDQIACTEELCTWNRSSFFTPGLFKRVGEMGYRLNRRLPKILVPTQEQNSNLLKKLAEMPGGPAAILLTAPGHSANYVPDVLKIALPKPIGSLFDKSCVGLPLNEVLEKCKELEHLVSCSIEQQSAISVLTSNQATSRWWFRYRSGRITASIFRKVLRTKQENPSVSLIKQICYPEAMAFKSEPTDWGIEMEPVALQAFERVLRENGLHSGFKITPAGTVISTENPIFSASPDGIFECEQFGKGVIEVKCPWKFKTLAIEAALLEPGCPMFFNENANEYALKEDHPYYYQMQMQMYCTSLNYGYFIMFTGPEIAYCYVKFNRSLMDEAIPLAKQFWSTAIMPELVAKHFTFKDLSPPSDPNDLQNQNPSIATTSSQDFEPRPAVGVLPCYCGDVVTNSADIPVKFCSVESCLRKIFHVDCIKKEMNLRIVQKNWKCKDCRTKIASENRKRKRNLLETDNTT